jgi:parallel beta-helix repeat protein
MKKLTVLFCLLVLTNWVSAQTSSTIKDLPLRTTLTDTSLFIVDYDSIGTVVTRSIKLQDMKKIIRSVVNIRDYGVVADGVTDDRVAIQAAMDSASTLNKALYVPPGTYAIGDSLIASNNLVMFGAGGKRSKILAITNNIVMVSVYYDTSVVIDGIWFESDNTSSAATNGNIIEGQYNDDIVIRDNHFTQFASRGIRLWYSDNLVIEGNTLTQDVVDSDAFDAAAIQVYSGGETFKIVNNTLTNTHPWDGLPVEDDDWNVGIFVQKNFVGAAAPKQGIITGNHIYGFNKYAIMTYGSTNNMTMPMTSDTAIVEFEISNNIMRRTGYMSFYNTGADRVNFHHNIMDSSGLNLTDEALPRGAIAVGGGRWGNYSDNIITNVANYHGISASNVFGSSFNNNIINKVNEDGIKIASGSYSKGTGSEITLNDTTESYVSVRGNKIFNAGLSGSVGNGINFVGASASELNYGVNVSDNQIRNVYQSGIHLTNARNSKISGNIIDDPDRRGINLNEVSFSILSGNIITHPDTADLAQNVIVLEANCDYNRVEGNIVDGGVYALFLVASDSNNVVIENTFVNQVSGQITGTGTGTDFGTNADEWTDYGAFLKPMDVGDNAIHIADVAGDDSVTLTVDATGNLTITPTGGVVMTKDVNMLKAGDSPRTLYSLLVGTDWIVYAEDTDDDLQVEVNTASTERVDFVNTGAGVVDVTIDGAAKIDTLEGFQNPVIVVTGDSTSGTLEIQLSNTSNSPTLGFYAPSSTEWDVFANDATDDLNVWVSTDTTEQVHFQNAGAGKMDVRVEGDAISERQVRTDSLNTRTGNIVVSGETAFDDSVYVPAGFVQVGNADTTGTLLFSSGQGAGNQLVSIQAVDSSETYTMTLPYKSDGTTTGMQITSSGDGGWYWAPAAGDALQRYWVDAGAFAPRVTAGPAIQSEEYATNDIQVDQLLFDGATTNEGAQWKGWPTNWNRGTFQVHYFWDAASGASAADSVVWQTQARVASDDDPIDGSWGTAVTTVDSVSAVGDVMVSALSSPITAGGSPAQNDLLWIEVERLQDNASDNMAEDAKFLGVLILYTAETMGGEDLGRDEIEIPAAAWVGTPANSAAFDTLGSYLLVQQFDQTTAESLVVDIALPANFESLDSVKVEVGTGDTAGDSAAFAMNVVGIADGESWQPGAGDFGSAFADTLDMGTTANVKKTMTIVGPLPLVAAGDRIIVKMWRDPSISNDVAADVYVVSVVFFGIGLEK